MGKQIMWSELVNTFTLYKEDGHYFLAKRNSYGTLLIKDELEDLLEALQQELGQSVTLVDAIGNSTFADMGEALDEACGESNYKWLLALEAILEQRLPVQTARAIRRLVREMID